MGSAVSAPFESVEAALAAGRTQEEVDNWLATSAAAAADSSPSASSTVDGNGDQQQQQTEQKTDDAEAPASSKSGGSVAAASPEQAAQTEAVAAGGAMDWGALFSHKGDFATLIPKSGPEPNFADPKKGWYWYGQDGTSGPELGIGGERQPPVSERAADVFYIHPTTYMDGVWNMPVDDATYKSATEFFVCVEASVFNDSCRVFAPRFRQGVLASMGFPDEGKLATDFAYADVRKAFEYYLANENRGRPFILASHSQGSLYAIRLMLDFIEGKPLLNQFVACYGLAAWAPLSLFEGENAVFKQIKVCRSPTDQACFVSWTCEHPATVKAHCAKREANEPGDWYPQMGHKVGENDWRVVQNEPIVCTNPLTWVSNNLGDPAQVKTEEWLGMLNIVAGVAAKDGNALPNMDALSGLVYMPKTEFGVRELLRMAPDEFHAQFKEEKTEFSVTANAVTGDLEVTALPAELGGSEIMSYEHLNFYLFWFNIRKNVAERLQAKLAA